MKRWILLAVVVGAAVVVVIWQAYGRRQDQLRLTQLGADNTRLEQRVADLNRALGATGSTAAPLANSGIQNAVRSGKPAANPEEAIALQKLRLTLADANASIARLETRADEADAQLRNLALENKRLTASETDLKDNLATANQTVDALQKELKSSRDRVTQVEIAYQKLRDQGGADTQKIAQLQQFANQLQDIHQRREVFLNSILRRYKQITEQYRSISGVLQAQRTDGSLSGTADLARIQDSIAMAEEDLRQLNSLNAEARLIQKKMSEK